MIYVFMRRGKPPSDTQHLYLKNKITMMYASCCDNGDLGHLRTADNNLDVINDITVVQRSCYLHSFSTFHDDKHTHTHPFNGPFLGLRRWAGARKVKPIWILMWKQETVSGSGISWVICKSAPCSRRMSLSCKDHVLMIMIKCLCNHNACQCVPGMHEKYIEVKE